MWVGLNGAQAALVQELRLHHRAAGTPSGGACTLQWHLPASLQLLLLLNLCM